MENKYKKLAKNSVWTLLGNAGSRLLGFLLLPLYTTWLGTEGFGISDLVSTYSSFLVCIMTLCVSDGIFVFSKNESVRGKMAFFSSTLSFIFFLFILWVLLFSCINIFVSIYDIHNSFTDNLWFIMGIVISTFLQQYIQQFILCLEKVKIYSLTGIVQCTSLLFFSFLLIPVLGVRGYILSIIYANLCTTIFCFVLSGSSHFFSLRVFDGKKVKDLLKYSIPLIPNGIMWWMVSALNRPVMEYSLDYSSIGIFAVANRFPGIVTMMFTVFSVAWNISVFDEFGKKNFVSFYKDVFRMLFFVVTVFASFLIIFSESIITFFTAPEFHDAWKYMTILVVGSVFSCVSGFLGSIFSVVKKSKYFFYSSLWAAISAIIFNVLLIPRLGLWGASISALLSFMIMMATRYFYSLKYVKVSLLLDIVSYAVLLLLISGISIYCDQILLRFLMSGAILLIFLLWNKNLIKPVLSIVKDRVVKLLNVNI